MYRKNLPALAVILLGTLCCTSCGGGTNSGAQDADSLANVSQPAFQGPLADAPTCSQERVVVAGKTYEVEVALAPDASLPIVKDEYDEFCDNRVTVTILCGNDTILCRAFTKEAFQDFLSKEDFENSVLDGMALYKEQCSPSGLVFGAGISRPADDVGHRFLVSVPLNGGAPSITRNTQPEADMQGSE